MANTIKILFPTCYMYFPNPDREIDFTEEILSFRLEWDVISLINSFDSFTISVLQPIIHDIVRELKEYADRSDDETIKSNCNFLILTIYECLIAKCNFYGRFNESYYWVFASISDYMIFEKFEGKSKYSLVYYTQKIRNISEFHNNRLEVILYPWISQLFYFDNQTCYISTELKELFPFIKETLFTVDFQHFDLSETTYTYYIDALCSIAEWLRVNQLDDSDFVAQIKKCWEYFDLPDLIELRITSTLAFSNSMEKQDQIEYLFSSIENLEIERKGSFFLHILMQFINVAPELYPMIMTLYPKALNIYMDFLGKTYWEGYDIKYHRLKNFSSVFPLIHYLSTRKNTSELTTSLSMYFGIKEEELCKKETFYIKLNDVDSYTLCTSDQLKEVSMGITFESLMEQLYKFLRLPMVLRINPEKELIDYGNRYGAPDETQGNKLEKLCNDFFSFGDNDYKNLKDKAMILIPSTQLPVQSIMLKKLGYTMPNMVSFQDPFPDRDVKKVCIIANGSLTSELEKNEVIKVFQSKNLWIDVYDDISIIDFIKSYQMDYDIFWISAHGEYDHTSPDNSFLKIGEQNIDIKLIYNIFLSFDNRRLLFLNLCDGATTMPHNGAISDIGLGSCLAENRQAVVSHLWPIDPMAALAFGVLYAIGISNGLSFFLSYEYAVNIMIEGSEKIIYEMETNNISNDVMNRIRNTQLDFDNICYWGALTFLE